MVELSSLFDLALAKLGAHYDSASEFHGHIPPSNGIWRRVQNTEKGAVQALIVLHDDKIMHIRRFSGGHYLELAIWFIHLSEPDSSFSSLNLCRARRGPHPIQAFTKTGLDVPLDQLPLELLARVEQILVSI